VPINTSFNGRGVPIVETAKDPFADAERMNLEVVLTDFGIFSSFLDLGICKALSAD
jgi:predicted NodU family carbamoyl transferase